MSTKECKGCEEYRQLTRRNFVGLSAGVVVPALAPGWLQRVVFAQEENSARDVIVSIFLRGGADGLTLCVPYTEQAYYDLRPTVAITPPDSGGSNKAIDLDGSFGFPQGMKPLKDAYRDGVLAIVHACGLRNGTRSHFEAMHFMEVGMKSPPASLFTGWLGRHLQVTAPTVADGAVRAIGIGAGLQRSLVGGPKTLPVRDLAEFGFEGRRGSRNERRTVLEEIYAAVGDPLEATAANSFKTIDVLKRIGFRSYHPSGGATYPEDEFGYALKSTAALIKADVGVEAIAIDLQGWDTHDSQGPMDGHMHLLMQSLAGSLAAFHKDLFAVDRRNVVAVAMSEFGRNAFENSSAGCDHGTGGLMLVLGGSVNGGQVITEWPGLEREQLFDGQDLQITIDYRDVLSEILTKRAANPNIKQVFADRGYRPRTHGVIV